MADASPVFRPSVSFQEFVGSDPLSRLDLFAGVFDTLFEFVGKKFLVQSGGSGQIGFR